MNDRPGGFSLSCGSAFDVPLRAETARTLVDRHSPVAPAAGSTATVSTRQPPVEGGPNQSMLIAPIKLQLPAGSATSKQGCCCCAA
jgi:hypothetical protein